MSHLLSFLIAAVVSLSLVAPVWADNEPRTGEPEKLGRVYFKTSCTPEAQKQFERALAMLHSFFFPETVKAFTAIPTTDPNCAIAYWGIAISQRPNPLVGPFDAATLKRGLDAIEKGEAIGPKTQRERDWLAALKEFYKDYDKVDQDTRTKNYAKAMERLAAKYGDDAEAKIFYALALNETFDHKSMEPLLRAIKILEPIDKKYPDHPGVTHYLIHSYDFPPIAQKGIPAANKYAQIAPSAPHAQHMPSHIYSMVGMWEESVKSNWRSVAVANDYTAKAKLDGTLGGVPHAYDFMAYAYLQLGKDREAKRVIDELRAVTKLSGARSYGADTGSIAPASRYVLERAAWAEAAALEVPSNKYTYAEAMPRFARAVGAARTRNLDLAKDEIARLQTLSKSAENSYWAEQIQVLVLAASAWRTRAEGRKDDALKFMRAAADLEDSTEKHVSMENRLYPMREMLGDLLLELGQPAAALQAYEASLHVAQNRLHGFYGAAKAAQAAGDRSKARAYFEKLAALGKNADPDRAELHEAKAFLLAQR